MHSKRIAFVVRSLLLVNALQVGCNSQAKQPAHPKASVLSEQRPSDEDLVKAVETFASSDDTSSAKAWKILEEYDHQKLISDLTRIYSSLPPAHYHRVLIAFAFCKLNYEYATNRRIVLSSLSRDSGFKDFCCDWPVHLVHELFLNGDKEVLADLFAAAEWSDGAAGEALAGFYSEAISNGPQQFLKSLSRQNSKTRGEVYELLRYASMRKEEVEKVMPFLRSVPINSDLYRTAQETIKALRSND